MGLALLDPAIWPQYIVYRAATDIEYNYEGIAQTVNNDPEYVAITVKARVQAGLAGKMSNIRDRDFEGRNTKGRITIFTKDDELGFDERLILDRNNPTLRRGDIMKVENQFYKIDEVSPVQNLSTLSKTVRHYKSIGYLEKNFQAPDIDPIEPFLPTLNILSSTVVFTADTPAGTIIDITAGGASWTQSGDTIDLGSSATAFQNDRGLILWRDSSTELSKGSEIFWESSTQVSYFKDFKSGQNLLIKKFIPS